MQTRDLTVTAVFGRPETLFLDSYGLPLGIYYGRVTYRITGVPVDVPGFEVKHFAQAELNFRPSHTANFEISWATLVLANRR